MKKSLKFSFIIAVYDPPEDLFRACLDSLLAQKEINFEIVAVNDGSTNDALDILFEYDRRYPGIFKIVTQENKGNGPAKKAGIENASGQYLWIVDQDDRVRPNCVKFFVDALERQEADQIVFKCALVDISEKEKPFPECGELQFREVSKEYVLANGYRAFWKRIVRKELVDKAAVDIPRSVHDDWPTTLRWTLESRKILVCESINYFWVQNNRSITHSKYYTPEFMKSSLKTCELLHAHAMAFPEFRKWILLEIFRSVRANLKRINISKGLSEANDPVVKQSFETLEREYNLWLDRYSEEDKTLVFLYDEARSGLLKHIKQLNGEISRLKKKCKALEKSRSYRLTKPFRFLAKYLRRMVGRK